MISEKTQEIIERLDREAQQRQSMKEERQSNCAGCNADLRYVWFAVEGVCYCDECFEHHFSWLDKTIPTKKRYKRRLI